MESISILIRPQTFEEGRYYLYRDRPNHGQELRLISVRFISYDPCNAFVIVGTKTGSIWRCSRDDIFLESHDLASCEVAKLPGLPGQSRLFGVPVEFAP